MRPDPILTLLSQLIESRHADGKPSLEVELVIHIGALFISGTVIPREEFMNQPKPLLKLLHEAHSSEIMSDAVSLDMSPSDLDRIFPQFIHLKNVSFSGPTGAWEPAIGESGEFWRGKLDSIDGFTLGGSFDRAIL